MIQPTIFDDEVELSRSASAWLIDRISQRPSLLMCLAAGGTPTLTYERLSDQGRRDPGLVSQMRVIQLDEWGGLASSDPASCQSQLRRQLVGPANLSERFAAIDGQAADPTAECARVAAWLEQHGPIDVCVLGLGLNGHLGFNEPGDSLHAHAHVAQLTTTSLNHAMVESLASKPSCGLTLGMADILLSREILVLVSGARKTEPLRRLLVGPITTAFPASLLHLHPKVTLLCDRSAWGGAALAH